MYILKLRTKAVQTFLVYYEGHVEVGNMLWVELLKLSQGQIVSDKYGETLHLKHTKNSQLLHVEHNTV